MHYEIRLNLHRVIVAPQVVLNNEISVGNKTNTWKPIWFVRSSIIAEVSVQYAGENRETGPSRC
jgi:hypothetical protein